MIIGVTGPAGSGKSTLAAWLAGARGFTRLSFADPLKDMLRALGLSEREIDGDLRETPCHRLCGATPRRALQTLATEWGRDLIAPGLWVEAWRLRALRCEHAVADDLHFACEAETVRRIGGVVWRVNRLGATAGGSVFETRTVSETQMASITPDAVLYNAGPEIKLYDAAAKLLETMP